MEDITGHQQTITTEIKKNPSEVVLESEIQKQAGRDDEDDESDAEVMQVVANEVNLRHPKSTTVNGTVNDDLNRERPMSWEGELSDEETPNSSIINSCVMSPNGQSNELSLRPSYPPGSPMCIGDKEEISRDADDGMSVKTEAEHGIPNGHHSPVKRNGEISETGSLTPCPFPSVLTTSPAPSTGSSPVCTIQGSHFLKDHLSVGSTASFENVLLSQCSPAQARHLIGYSPYSQSSSPVLTHPPSSCSSRSSYSPTHSPHSTRHATSASSVYSHTQSPVFPRHTAGNSSDGSLYSPANSPLQGRHVPIPDGAVSSPTQSPSQRRHSDVNGVNQFSPNHNLTHHLPYNRIVPFGASPSPTLLYRNATVTPDQSVSSSTESTYHCTIPDHSGNDGTPAVSNHSAQDTRSTTSSASVASSASDESNASDLTSPIRRLSADNSEESRSLFPDMPQSALGASGISRQQLLSGPCPICGDRISGFHYGIFSCESCKGFFKRTVQNKKNYVCLRGATCHIAVSTRKKCPACRFDKCLKMGMKLEAIREDRTRGGRSTYQCSYTLPSQPVTDARLSSVTDPVPAACQNDSTHLSPEPSPPRLCKAESPPSVLVNQPQPIIPPLIQDILSVEHLWHCSDKEMSRMPEQCRGPPADPDFLNSLCNIADHRLYKIVKWCKSLPLFREIQIDDQTALLINSWCELLLLSCCYRSMGTPNEIRVSNGRSVTLREAQILGLDPVIERMLNLTEHFRRLQVDQSEYVSLKVITLLTSDVSGLKEPEKVRHCQKQVLEALQLYMRTHYPQHPSKFGELLLRIPELQRACQVGKESLAARQREGDMPSFNLLMELLRGDH